MVTIDLATEKEGQFAQVAQLFDAKGGIVRDSDLSYDGNRMLFASRKSKELVSTTREVAPETGDYQVYEMDLMTKKIRQLTTDETYGADYEAA